jgi:hypothetical protein
MHNIDLSHKNLLVMIMQLRSNFQMNNKLHVLRRGLMYVNLDEFASSPQHLLAFINLSNTINAFIACTLQFLITTLVAPRNTRVKCKRTNMFSQVIDATNKNIKVVMEAMDCINFMQLEIEKRCMKI